MAKIPFDIKFRPQIESGEYKAVIYMGNDPTEECPVEILKWNSNSDAGCIVGCFRVKGKDKLYVFDKNGEHKVSGIRGNRLFIITPEPELTEWQTFISGCLQKYGLLDCGAADRIAKECSAELLNLARTELICQGNIVLSIEEFEKCFIEAQEKGRKEALKKFEEKYKQSWFNEGKIAGKYEGLTEDEKYQQGVHDGKEEVLKGLPRWKHNISYCDKPFICGTFQEDDSVAYRLEYKGRTIMLSDIEKLPGFKE